MRRVLHATYHNGNLVLDEKLDAALEGQKLTLILVEAESPSQVQLEQSERTQSFLKWAQQYSAKLPPDYKSEFWAVAKSLFTTALKIFGKT